VATEQDDREDSQQAQPTSRDSAIVYLSIDRESNGATGQEVIGSKHAHHYVSKAGSFFPSVMKMIIKRQFFGSWRRTSGSAWDKPEIMSKAVMVAP
jgi:hypothetical protein